MANDTRRYKAQINDKQYIIVGPGSDQHMAAVTKLVNDQLEQIKAMAPDLSAEDAAILLAFNAVSDQVNLQQAAQETTNQAPQE